ncbi:MAG: Spy/CpxP family protein refolding chaperone [Myxococcota bacterium]
MTNFMTRIVLGAGLLSLGALGATSLSAVAEDVSSNAPTAESCEDDRARPDGRRGHRGKGHRMMKAVESLDLSADQQAEIDAIKDDIRAERQAARDARPEGARGNRGMHNELFSADPIDADALHAQLDERMARQNARAHKQLDWTIDILDVLTPEQRAELGEMADANRSERANRAHRR